MVLNEDSSLWFENYPVNQIVPPNKPLKIYCRSPTFHSEDTIWLLVNGYPESWFKGNINEIVISFMDITEKVEMEL
jgi:hypothetical protein